MESKDVSYAGPEVEKSFPLPVFAPFDPQVDLYVYSKAYGLGYDCAVPYEYKGWREEVMSWKKSCYLHAGLNAAPIFRVKGPDAIKFFSDISVNSYAKFPIGSLKHCIMCGESGNIMAHGVLMRIDEEEFLTFFLAPYAAYKLYTSNKYNITGEFVNDLCTLQLGGPRSLEILETATGECLHDIKFAKHRKSKINDVEVRIVRLGMAGTLAYEVHCNPVDARMIYNALMNAGESFGITKLGFLAYQLNHTEDGFPQSFMHFPYAWGEDPGLLQFLKMPGYSFPLQGSMGDDITLRYRNPIELGWEKAVKFDHDFIGRAALEKEAANPTRTMVTLEWNSEDIIDVYASEFQPGDHYMPMGPNHFGQLHGNITFFADKVLKDGKVIGISSGRNYSYYYRKMISLCSIDTAYSQLGTEVTILWGNPGTRQKEIRAIVSRFPYLNENRNENVDVNTIPCQINKK